MYREWGPMYGLLSKIPARLHRSFLGYDLNLTCVAAHGHYLALGTNAGLVYWYDRRTRDLRRLWCQDRVSEITAIALVESVDFMLAVGNKEGRLTIFQIPRLVDHNVVMRGNLQSGDSNCDTNNESTTECFHIPDVHTRGITAITWSMNGHRLFSGDKNGLVS